MRAKKIVLSVVLASVLCIMAGQNAGAAEVSSLEGDDGISVCSLYSNSTVTTLSIKNKTASIMGRISGKAGVTTKTRIKLTLQKYANGKWSAVQSYEKTASTTSCTLSKSRAVSSGKYRVKGVYTAYKGSKSETLTVYSGTQTC